MIDAETEAAILYDFASHPELRSAVKTEFTRSHELFADYHKGLSAAGVAAPNKSGAGSAGDDLTNPAHHFTLA